MRVASPPCRVFTDSLAEGNVDVSSEAKEKAEREKRQLAKLRKEFRYQAALWF